MWSLFNSIFCLVASLLLDPYLRNRDWGVNTNLALPHLLPSGHWEVACHPLWLDSDGLPILSVLHRSRDEQGG